MNAILYKSVIDPPLNCVYYNSSTKNILFDVYEGIPQNLIINILGWMILLVLFTMLRRRASNYGRLALVQHSETWTEFFYQLPQDLNPVGPSGDNAETVSTSSREGINDTGGLSWIFATLRISSEDILRKCGPDAVHYLSFQKHVIIYLLIMMFISIVVILPLNFQGNLQGDETTFGHTTVSNLSPDSPLLWVHLTIALIYFPLGIAIMRRFSVKAHIKDTYMKSSATIIISNISRSVCNKEDIQEHFREAYPQINITEIQLAYDVRLLDNLERDRVQASQARVYCEDYIRRKRKPLTLKPKLCARFCPCSTKVDALDYYKEEERKLTLAVEAVRAESLTRPIGVVFVTFRSVEAAKEVLQDWQPNVVACGGGCARAPAVSHLSTRLKPHEWRVQCAPPKNDILWENLSVPYNNWYIRAFFINLFLFVLLFFLTTPAYVLNMLTTVHFTDALLDINPIISQFLPTLIMWTASALLPNLVGWSDKFLGHWTRSEQNHSIMRKTYYFLLFMVLILPSVGLTSAQAFVEWAWHWQDGSNRWECLFLPDKGAFFVNYVITSSLIGTGLELLRFSELFFYLVELCMARSQAETSAIRRFILTDFPFGIHYAWMLLIFTMTTMFSLSCPIITVAGVQYMILKHFVDRYNLYFVYRPSKLSGKIHGTAVSCVVFAPILVQVAFLALCILRRGHNTAISVFAIITTLISVIAAIALSVFNCCTDISPIIYERKKESSRTTKPESRSSFVPEILSNETSTDPENNQEQVRDYGTNPQIM